MSDATHNGAAVQADGLVKHYAGKEIIEAVRGVDLRVEAGEVFGFLGPNGAGKSTTVKMLTTLLSITAGTAFVAGVDVARDPDEARRRMGVALQEAGLDPRQTGRELLVLQGRLFGMSPSACGGTWTKSDCRPMSKSRCPRNCPAACVSSSAWPGRWLSTRR